MKKYLNRQSLSFMGVECFIWSGVAFYYPFFVPYLKSAGYDEIHIGIITSVMSFVSILGPILWGAVIDRLKSAKVLMVANLLAGCAVMQLVPAASRHFGLLLAALAAVYFTVFPMMTALDSWIMRLKGRGVPINYGLARGTGSLAYAFASTAAGIILTKTGLPAMFLFTLGVECVAVLCILLVRSEPETGLGDAGQAPDAEEGPEPPAIHRNAPYILFVLLATLLYIGVNSAQNFYWILLQSAGGTPADQGLALGVCALSEFPVFFLSNRLLRKYKDTALLLASMGFYVLRLFLFFTMHSVAGLVLAQVTNSLSFALFLPASLHYISRITPARTRATGLSLAASLYSGFGGIVGNLVGGFVIASLGIRFLYGGAAVFAAVVTVAFALVLLLQRSAQPSLPKSRPSRAVKGG